MSAAVDDRPPSALPHSSPSPAELPSFGPFPPRTPTADASLQKTPTQATFDAASKSRAAHPSSPAPAHFRSDSNRDRINAHRSNASLESIQTDMKTEDHDSENESDASDSRPSKKKKGQRFYCTDYPPCNLSFTRSEHLARHIRKHTGERPFQCHCMRRFSRLDNLRQHAQTVHVNEDIPGDSLAATGTRFQRQVRTDRVKTHRNRNSTLSGGGAHSRGHSRNMSGSSIGSVSDIGVPDDGRRRPPPIAMAQGPPRTGLAVDTYSANSHGSEQPYYSFSPSGYSTPMSAYSQDVGSPAAQPASLNSPIHFTPRGQWESRTPAHARRLSVPTQPSLYQQAALSAAGSAQYASPAAHGHPQFSPIASSMASPVSSTFSSDARSEQPESPESVWKRRTWHPTTAYTGPRPATSGLSYYQTPDAPQPIPASQPAAQQSIRLPGIETFDRAHVQPIAPPRRAPDVQDTPMRDVSHGQQASDAGSKRNSWSSINQHVSQIDIAAQTPPTDAAWQPAPPHGPRPVTAPYGSSASNHLPPMEPSLAPASQHPATPQRTMPQIFSSEPGPALIDESPNFRTSPAESASSENLPTPGNAPLLGHPPVVLQRNNSGELPPAHLVDEAARDKLRSAASQHYFQSHANTHPAAQMSGPPPVNMTPLDTLAAAATRNAEQEGR